MMRMTKLAVTFAAASLALVPMFAASALASATNSKGADEIVERCIELTDLGYYDSIGECMRTFNKSEVEICQNNRVGEIDFDKNQGQCVKRNRKATRQ